MPRIRSLPMHQVYVWLEKTNSFKINFYCFISLLTRFYFPAVEQPIVNKKKKPHTLSTILIWFFYLPLLFSCKHTGPAEIANAKLFCLLQTTKLKTTRNSNVRRYRKKNRSSNSLFEISIFTNCSSFPITIASLPSLSSPHLHFNFPICLVLVLFYLDPSFFCLLCTYFSLLGKNKDICLNNFSNYCLTAATTQSTFLWAFCIFHFYAFIIKLVPKVWL